VIDLGNLEARLTKVCVHHLRKTHLQASLLERPSAGSGRESAMAPQPSPFKMRRTQVTYCAQRVA